MFPPESQTPTWTPGMVLHWNPQEPQFMVSVLLSTQEPVQQVFVLAHWLPQVPQLRMRKHQTVCNHHPGLAVGCGTFASMPGSLLLPAQGPAWQVSVLVHL